MGVSPARKYPAVLALAGAVIGILAAEYCPFPAYPYLILSLIIFVVSLIFYNQGRLLFAAVIGLLTLATLLAFGYAFRIKTFPPGHIVNFVDDETPHLIFGTVDDWPILKENRTELYLKVDSLSTERLTSKSSGRILVRIMTNTTRLQYGDRVMFESRIYSIKGGKNPTGLDYRRYLVLKEVFGVCYLPHQFAIQVDPIGEGNLRRLTGHLRRAIVEVFRRTLETDAAALATGFLIGETRDIPPRIYNLFRDSGTLHLLAVSGSNVALVIMLFAFIFRASPFSIATRTVLLLIIILIFSFLAYNQPSVVRASIMAALILLGKLLQKRIDFHNIIASTALLILIFKPTELFDIGFQLSFACAWGLIFFVPKVAGFFRRWRRTIAYRYIALPLIFCLIAQVVSIPLSGFYFHRLPLISFAANLVIMPLVGIIVTGEVILLIVSFVLPVVGDFIGAILNIFLNLNILFLEIFGSDVFNLSAGEFINLFTLIAYYLFFVLLLEAISSQKYRRLLIVFLLLLLNAVSIVHLTRSETEFRLTVFSIPNGLVAIEHSSPPRVILANMPRRDYSYAELVVAPYLSNQDIADPEVIALDGDYQTLLEALEVSGMSNADLYIPDYARNLFHDVTAQNERKTDDKRVIFYSKASEQPGQLERGISLRKGNLTYHIDRYIIAIYSNSPLQTLSQDDSRNESASSILVIPILDQPEWLALEGRKDLQYIVCNRITREVRVRLDAAQIDPERITPQLFETSRLGAADIILENGRLKVEN